MTRREWDPLALIPSAETVRRKLAQTEERARKLRILLSTAEQIEQCSSSHSQNQAASQA